MAHNEEPAVFWAPPFKLDLRLEAGYTFAPFGDGHGVAIGAPLILQGRNTAQQQQQNVNKYVFVTIWGAMGGGGGRVSIFKMGPSC